VDETGALWTDNVDVAAVIPRDERDLWPLAALLNGEQLDRIWRMRAKPFQNGYLSANKQFLAWLPVVGLGESDARQDDGAEDGPLSRSV
jgi:hypothetical protein